MKSIILALLVGAALIAGGITVVTEGVGLSQAHAGCLDQRQC
jgi:hypothetical protein